MDYIVKNFDDNEVEKLKNIIIAVHGFSSTRNSFVLAKIAPILKENNIGMICFDLPGHGLRKNELLTVDACLKSIAEIENNLRKIYSGKISLTGASFGGFLILRYLENNKNMYDKIILRAPALNQWEIWKDDVLEDGNKLIKSLENGRNYDLNGMEVDVSVLNDYFKFDIFNHVDLNQDIRLLYGTNDVTVSNKYIFDLSKLKSWHLYEIIGADHFCRRVEDISNIAKIFIDIINEK